MSKPDLGLERTRCLSTSLKIDGFEEADKLFQIIRERARHTFYIVLAIFDV